MLYNICYIYVHIYNMYILYIRYIYIYAMLHYIFIKYNLQ